MRIKAISLVLSLLFIYSCSHKTKNGKQQDKKLLLVDTLLNVTSVQDKKKDTLQLTLEKVNFRSIKQEYKNSYTSGILPKPENNNFEFQEFSNAFVGIYYFTLATSEIPFVANAVIMREHGREWNYSDNNEKLVEFTSYSNLLNPFQEILSIGDSKEEVVKKFRNNPNELESNLIYFDSFGNAATLLFNKDTVQAIRVGKYKATNELRPIKLKW